MGSGERGSGAGGVHVALLRAINVGGTKKLLMAELRAMFEAAGCADVRTYIQSGNVVFRAEKALAARIPALIQAEIAASKGFQVPVVTRTAAELDGGRKRQSVPGGRRGPGQDSTWGSWPRRPARRGSRSWTRTARRRMRSRCGDARSTCTFRRASLGQS